MVCLLATDVNMIIAKRLYWFERELAFLALYFLQTQNIRLYFLQKALNQIDAQANRVDVPGGYFKCHWKTLY